MAWSASLKSITKSNGVATVTMTFTNGAGQFDKSYQIGHPGDDFIPKQAKQEVRNLEALDAWVDASRPGPIATVETPPSAAENAAALFFAKRRKLASMKEAQANGWMEKSGSVVTALAVEVAAEFKIEYVTDFRWGG